MINEINLKPGWLREDMKIALWWLSDTLEMQCPMYCPKDIVSCFHSQCPRARALREDKKRVSENE